MFCANCKHEYRDGFHHCTECNMELVDELAPIENNKNQDAFSGHSKIKSNVKYYLLNGILGFIGGPLFLLFITIVATQSQRLPPEWGEQRNTNMAPLLLVLFFLMIIIAVNIMGVISFIRKNKTIGTGGQGAKLFKFILLNLVTFVASFVVFIFIGSIFLKI